MEFAHLYHGADTGDGHHPDDTPMASRFGTPIRGTRTSCRMRIHPAKHGKYLQGKWAYRVNPFITGAGSILRFANPRVAVTSSIEADLRNTTEKGV